MPAFFCAAALNPPILLASSLVHTDAKPMKKLTHFRQALTGLALFSAVLAASSAFGASLRRFEPVLQDPSQNVQTVNGMLIISAAGKRFGAGASIAPASLKQAWLSVSLKNTGTTPLDLEGKAVRVLANGRAAELRSAAEALGKVHGDGYVRDKCALASASSQLNCNIDSFNAKQHERMASVAEAHRQLAPGELIATQFQVDLPKKSGKTPSLLKVIVSAGGEDLTFDFKEVE